MKRILLLTIAALTLGVGQLFSQSKVGHVEYEYLIYLMPEIKDIEKKIFDKQQEYQKIIASREAELQQLISEINDPNLDPLIRQNKQARAENVQRDGIEFQQKAQTSLAKEQEKQLKPVLDRLDNGIKEVATEKGYDYVLSKTASQGYIVIFAKNEEDNLTKAVMAKLGLKEPANDTTSPATESLLVQPK